MKKGCKSCSRVISNLERTLQPQRVQLDGMPQAGTDWKMDTEILTYSRAKGAFAGLTLEGASIRQDNDSRHAIYGPKVTTRALLLGKVPAPAAAQPFLAEVRGAKAQAVAEGKAEAKEEIKQKEKK